MGRAESDPPWIYRHPELAKEEKLVAEAVAKGLATLPPATPRKEGPIIGNMNSRVYHRHEKERIPLLRLIRTWMAISQYMLWGISTVTKKHRRRLTVQMSLILWCARLESNQRPSA